jgi:aspartate kinase
MFRALADERINIIAITTSTIKISVLVAREQGLAALRAVHREFELEKPPRERSRFGDEQPIKIETVNAADVVARLQNMENLTIHSVLVDSSQSLITISDVPDRPGVSAEMFEAIAAERLLVDIIVQGVGKAECTNISFTVPEPSAAEAKQVAEEMSRSIGGIVTANSDIAILTVNGIGIRSHTGVGVRMFRALSAAGINVEMISTSEMRVNVVIERKYAQQGLTALKQAFSDVVETN